MPLLDLAQYQHLTPGSISFTGIRVNPLDPATIAELRTLRQEASQLGLTIEVQQDTGELSCWNIPASCSKEEACLGTMAYLASLWAGQ